MKQSEVELLKSLLIKKSKINSKNGVLEIDNTADGLKARIISIESNKLYQDSREGYNKFNSSLIASGTGNGVDFSISSGKLILNGNSNSSQYIYNDNSKIIANLAPGDYTFFVKMVGGIIDLKSGKLGFYLNENENETETQISNIVLGSSNTFIKNNFSITEEKQLYLKIYANAAEEFFENAEFELMILEGTYTTENAPVFEQYGVMPSLDYESEVKGVTGNIEVLINNGLQSSDSDYKSQLQEISLGSKVLYGNEIARDGIVLKDGKWNWKNNFKKYIIKNTDVFIQGTPNNRFYINTELNNKNYFAMSNYFKSGNEENFDVNSTIVLQSNRINLMTNNYTVEQLNARLKELNESGHPLYVVYPLAEAELEEITDSNLIKQLNYLLYHLIEYDDKTYITADEEIEFEALVEQDKLRILENRGNVYE